MILLKYLIIQLLSCFSIDFESIKFLYEEFTEIYLFWELELMLLAD